MPVNPLPADYRPGTGRPSEAIGKSKMPVGMSVEYPTFLT